MPCPSTFTFICRSATTPSNNPMMGQPANQATITHFGPQSQLPELSHSTKVFPLIFNFYMQHLGCQEFPFGTLNQVLILSKAWLLKEEGGRKGRRRARKACVMTPLSSKIPTSLIIPDVPCMQLVWMCCGILPTSNDTSSGRVHCSELDC